MEQKKWYKSTTIWGIFIGILGSILMANGIEYGSQLPENADAEQILAYYEQIKDADGNVSSLIGIGVSALGFLMALIGRVKAEKKVKL